MSISDQTPVKERSQNEPASGGAFGCSDDSTLRPIAPGAKLLPRRASILKLPSVERIGILFIMVSAVACAVALLVSYVESLRDSAPLPTHGDALPSGNSKKIGLAMVNDRSAPTDDWLRRASSAIPMGKQRFPQSTFIAPNQWALKVGIKLGSAANQLPIPPVSDTSITTSEAPVSVPPAAAELGEPVATLDNQESTRLINRGTVFLKEGDFAAARLLFRRAADAGSGEAALALGLTYDPAIIKQLGAVSVTPDVDSALKWYRTATDRGSVEGADQFGNLVRATQNQK